MRNFIFGKTVNTTNTAIPALASGAVGVYDLSTGKAVPLTYSTTVTGSVKGEGILAVGRDVANGGPLTLPIHAKDFSWVRADFVASTTFTQTVKVVSQDKVGDYTIIVAKKGVPFNERNKWTATVHVYDSDETVASIASKLCKAINNNSESSGVSATVSGDTITITAATKGVDYKLILADLATMSTLGTATKGSKGQLSVEDLKDLAKKAAADAGFRDTYDEEVKLYPIYPLDPLKVNTTTAPEFALYTLKFAEPRKSRTTDTLVYQIIQVALPVQSGTKGIASFEAILDAIKQ